MIRRVFGLFFGLFSISNLGYMLVDMALNKPWIEIFGMRYFFGQSINLARLSKKWNSLHSRSKKKVR